MKGGGDTKLDSRKNVCYHLIMIEKTCESCGKKISIIAWRATHRKHHFCSVPCRYNFQKVSMLGEGNHFYGKEHTQDTKNAISSKKKGMPNNRLGKHFTLEQRKRMSESKKSYWKKHPEVLEAIRLKNIGRARPLEAIKKTSEKNRGRKRTQEQVARIKASIKRGRDCHFWRGGVSTETHSLRNSSEMEHWRLSVFQRDNFQCQFCGAKKCDLHAHHQIPFSFLYRKRKEEMFSVGNGVTLCVPCHKLTFTYARNAL